MMGVVIAMLLLSGCTNPAVQRTPTPTVTTPTVAPTNSTPTPSPSPTPTPTPTANVTPSPTSSPTPNVTATVTPTPTPNPDRIDCGAQPPLQRRSNDSAYYTGPLFDAHFHMPQFFKLQGEHSNAPVLDQDVSRREVICLFGKDRVRGPFAFYGIPSNLKDQALSAIQDIDRKDPGNMTHFLEFVVFPGYPVDPPQIQGILSANLRLFGGYGELSLYLPHYQGVNPDDPKMLELYGIAERHHLVVMMHPLEPQQAAVERAMSAFPNVTFLFHAAERLSWSSAMFDKMLTDHPNARYSVDIVLYGDDPTGRPLLDAAQSEQDFANRLGQAWNATLDQKVQFWKPKIEAHPDRFLWGTDRGTAAWQYTQGTAALLEEFARSFIARLAPAVQSKYAYQNAEALLAA